jgi:hypothetical protein
MNREKSYKHNPLIEERYFSSDIESMKNYDSQFRKAIESGEPYEFTIKLSEIIELCPRQKVGKESYQRFAKFLSTKGITMNLVSRKKGHKDLSENKLKEN